MRRLINGLSPAWRADKDDQVGAVAAIVAVLVSSSLIVVSMAFVFDFGRIYVEKRVVQNAADAALASLAQHCAKGSQICKSVDLALSDSTMIANGNSPDGLTRIVSICDSGSRLPFPTCDANDLNSPSSAGPTNTCSPIQPPERRSYLRLVTATKTSSNPGTALAPVFAPLITGSNSGDVLLGCSQVAMAAVGAIARGITPIALGVCSYLETSMTHFPDFDNSEPCVKVDTSGKTFNFIGPKGFAYISHSGKASSSLTLMKCAESDGVPLSVFSGSYADAPNSAVLKRETAAEAVCPGYLAKSGGGVATDVKQWLADNLNQVVTVPLVTIGSTTGGAGQWEFVIKSFANFKVTGVCIGTFRRGTLTSAPPCNNVGNPHKLEGVFSSVLTRGPGFTETYDQDVPWTGVVTLNNLP